MKSHDKTKIKLNRPVGHRKTIRTVYDDCGICGGYSGNGMVFPPRTPVFSDQWPSTNAMQKAIFVYSFVGLEVACWPLVPKFAGSIPAEAVGFLRVNKILSTSGGMDVCLL